MDNIVNKKNILIKEVFFFFNFLLFSFVILELLIPGFILYYININFLIVACFILAIIDLKVNS